MKRLLLLSMAAGLLLAGVSTLSACNGARDDALKVVNSSGNKGFMIKELVRGDRHRKYGLFIPMSLVSANQPQKYPVIIFLHGMGEGGSDAHANLRVGLAPFVADQKDTFNFIVIFPQSGGGSWNENSEDAVDVMAALEEVSKSYPCDMDRVSLTGLSTGGYGTWAIGAKYKDHFAALVPMGSSAADFKDAETLKDMPIRVYHNNGDPFAGMWNDTVMVEKVNSFGGKAEMFKTDGPGHDCWEIAYGQTDMFAWLAQQRRSSRTSAALPGRSSSSAAPVAPIARPSTPPTPIFETPAPSSATGTRTPY